MAKDTGVREELIRLGYRALPVTVVGDRAVVGFNPPVLCELLGLPLERRDDSRDVAWFREKLELLLEAAIRATAQLPSSALDWAPPERDRPLREFIYHALNQVLLCFRAGGTSEFPHQAEEVRVHQASAFGTPEDLCQLGREVILATQQWAQAAGPDELIKTVRTYFGEVTLGELVDLYALGHLAHHLRQLYTYLGALGIEPRDPLSSSETEAMGVPTMLSTP